MLINLLLIFSCFLGLSFSSEKVRFEPERGFYTTPFNLTLTLPKSMDDPKMYSIKYTIVSDASHYTTFPSMNTGIAYKGPITISRTSIVLAIAMNATYNTTITSSTFIFLNDVIRQSTMYQPNVAEVGVDNLLKGLVVAPSLSISTPNFYPIDCNNGTTPVPNNAGIDPAVWPSCRANNPRWGRVEYLDPSNPDKNWFEQMWFDIYGGASRLFIKKNIRIHFEGDLDFKMFKGFDWGVGSSRRFKALDLRGHSQDGITGLGAGLNACWAKNIFQDWTMQDANRIAPHARYIHLYFNSRYEGQYHLRERLSTHFLSSYLGGDRDEYEAVNSGRITDGEFAIVNSTYTDIVSNSTFAHLDKYFDWEAYLFYSLLQHYGANSDLATHNWQLVGPHKTKPFQGKNGGWKFFPSDGDATFYGAVDRETTNVNFQGNTFLSLINERNPDFMLMFQDAQFKALERYDGLLTVAAAQERFRRIETLLQLDLIMRPEMVRWGYIPELYRHKRSDTYSFRQWVDALSFVKATYLPVRTTNLLAQYERIGWRNNVGGFDFNLKDGQTYPQGTNLIITARKAAPIASFFYTVDGTDPRERIGGKIGLSAIKMNFGPDARTVTIPNFRETTIVQGRIRYYDGSWGTFNQMTVIIGNQTECKMCSKIIISEVHYHPHDKTSPLSNFIEIKNIANKPVLMTGATISGINNYTFGVLTLAPQQFYIIGFFYEDFNASYNQYPDDIHLAQISQDNNGDRITLKDQHGNVVHDLDFATRRPWTQMADGHGYSLVAKPELYKEMAMNGGKAKDSHFRYWRHSENKQGSPWKDDPPANPNRDITLEFKFVSFEHDWCELINPTLVDVDVSHWAIQNRYFADKSDEEYIIPAGTVIKAGETLRMKNIGIDFTRGHRVIIFKYDANMNAYTGDFKEFMVEEHELAV